MATKLLPRFYSTKGLPDKSGLVPISPRMAGLPFEAMSQTGEKIEGLGLHAANVFDQMKEREQIASDALKAVELDNTLKNESLGIADKFKDRVDYENFDKDIENEINSLRGRIIPKEPSQALNLAFEKAFNQESFHLRTTVKAKKYDVMNLRGKIAFGQILDRAYQDYADTDDPTKREIIKNQLEIQGEILRGKHLIDPVWIDDKLRTFDKSAKTVASDLADVKADKAIMANPGQASIDLTDSKYLPDLLPKQRQDKIEKANAAFKVFGNEQKKKSDEELKLKKDEQEETIRVAIRKGEYTKAYVLADSAKLLDTRERKYWTDAIDGLTKVKEGKIDPAMETAQIVLTNDMISKGLMSPSAIKDHIIRTPLMGKENKEQFINKLESKLSQEIKDGRNEAYKDIVSIIFPRKGTISLDNLIMTPQQTMGILKAQTALDDWIDSQTKGNKYPTRNEIRKKGWSLAVENMPTFAEKQEYLSNMGK